MESEKILQNLISGQFMPEIHYGQTEFSFRTVFHCSNYAYCCCTCAFENEFIDYIDEKGNVNGDMYARIVKSVVDGQCPHVHRAPKSYLQTTTVTAAHISAAVGTEQVFEKGKYLDSYTRGIFHLMPYEIAIVKKNLKTMSLKRICNFDRPTQYAERSVNDANIITIEYMTHLEMCVWQENIDMLKSRLKHGIHAAVVDALRYTFDKGLQEMQDLLLAQSDWFKRKENLTSLVRCCQLAIIYDQPRALDILLDHTETDEIRNELSKRINKLCCVLQRERCQSVLIEHNLDTLSEMAVLNRIDGLVCLLDFDYIRQEVVDILNTIPDISDILDSDLAWRFGSASKLLKKGYGWVHNFFYHSYNCLRLATVFDFGVNLHCPIDEMWVLSHCLHFGRIHKTPIPFLRQALEVILYENPDTEEYPYLISSAIQPDENMISWKAKEIKMYNLKGGFVMDAKKHSYFGHDGDENLALNFFAPLLLECGFSMNQANLEFFLHKKSNLHPAELLYIHDWLKTPRSLTVLCRNTIRGYFLGRRLHSFVHNLEVCQKVKEFLLLKTVLKCPRENMFSRKGFLLALPDHKPYLDSFDMLDMKYDGSCLIDVPDPLFE